MYQLKKEYLEAILQYLSKQPYADVVGLIQMIQTAQPVPVEEKKEDRKKDVKKESPKKGQKDE